jgi:hypothetical protein
LFLFFSLFSSSFQPAVNYYANSIYLSRDLPLYLPEQPYSASYREPPSLDYQPDYLTRDSLRHHRSSSDHLVPDYSGLHAQSDYATWDHRRQRAVGGGRDRRQAGTLGRGDRAHKRYINGQQDGGAASHV